MFVLRLCIFSHPAGRCQGQTLAWKFVLTSDPKGSTIAKIVAIIRNKADLITLFRSRSLVDVLNQSLGYPHHLTNHYGVLWPGHGHVLRVAFIVTDQQPVAAVVPPRPLDE